MVVTLMRKRAPSLMIEATDGVATVIQGANHIQGVRRDEQPQPKKAMDEGNSVTLTRHEEADTTLLLPHMTLPMEVPNGEVVANSGVVLKKIVSEDTSLWLDLRRDGNGSSAFHFSPVTANLVAAPIQRTQVQFSVEKKVVEEGISGAENSPKQLNTIPMARPSSHEGSLYVGQGKQSHLAAFSMALRGFIPASFQPTSHKARPQKLVWKPKETVLAQPLSN